MIKKSVRVGQDGDDLFVSCKTWSYFLSDTMASLIEIQMRNMDQVIAVRFVVDEKGDVRVMFCIEFHQFGEE